MNRFARYWRAQYWCSGLLLAALLLRGLVPVGYMPAVENGVLTLELCGALQYRVPLAKVQQPEDAHEHHHHGSSKEHEHGGATSTSHGSACPFAATALTAPPPVAVAYAAALDWTLVRGARAPQIFVSLVVPRSQSARAPPPLA